MTDESIQKLYSNNFPADYDAKLHCNVSGIFTKLLLVKFNDHPDYYMIELQEVKDGDVLGMIVLTTVQ